MTKMCSDQPQVGKKTRHSLRRSKEAKIDYSLFSCAVCQAPANGLHYGAISCRSCNAFFRRAITCKQHFVCRKVLNNDFDDAKGRCLCRACRLAKCKLAGMREKDVQPKREPTGSQKNRKPPAAKRPVKMERTADRSDLACMEAPNTPRSAKKEKMGQQTPLKTAMISATAELGSHLNPLIRGQHKDLQSLVEFENLVEKYRDHLSWMNRMMSDIETYLNGEYRKNYPISHHLYSISMISAQHTKWRAMQPDDINLLSKVELTGLMYWVDTLDSFRILPEKDRDTLFKRYSVRKLSLDHFYIASKYPELMAKGNFAMPNNTFVPPHRTGFETIVDDQRTIKSKFEILRPTIDRLWEAIVMPFAKMQITDAEIVALHLLMMWSGTNNRHVQCPSTREVMRARRDWTIRALHRHYVAAGIDDPALRLGQVLLMLPELEVICDVHCKDVQVTQLFHFCNLSEYWYEKYAYTSLNIV